MATPNMPRFCSAVRMDKETFARLLSLLSGPRGGLCSTKNICLGEKVMIFMSLLCGCSNRMLAERWQHSPSTISAVIHEVLGIVTSDAVTKFLMVRYNTREVQPQILQNKKFSPFFDNCIGAIDGTHIPAVAPENEQHAFHNQKGTVMQNLLGVVNFDLTFQYALTGWEGSTHYGKVFQDALTKGLNIPVGKYYLGDAGYALKPYCLTPYRGTRYHLKEFARAQEKPQTKEELFNLQHSSLRSAVEHTFGIVKKRFPI